MTERSPEKQTPIENITVTSAVPALLRGDSSEYNALSEWYLARLRKNAFFPDISTLTPKQLVAADNQLVESIVRAHGRVGGDEEIDRRKKRIALFLGLLGVAAAVAGAFGQDMMLTVSGLVSLAWIAWATVSTPNRALNIGFAGFLTALGIMLIGFQNVSPVSIKVALIIAVINTAAMFLLYRLKVLMYFKRIDEKARRLFESYQPPPGTSEMDSFEELIKMAARTLREALEREAAIVEYAAQAILYIDADLKVKAANRLTQTMWGLYPIQLMDVIVTELTTDAKKLQAAFAAAKEQLSTQTCDVKTGNIATANGYTRWYIDWSNSSRCYFCVVDDVTNQTMLELRKKQFVSMISHDLKSPLTALDFLLEMLNSGFYGQLNQKGQDSVAMSSNAVRRLIQMINQLLDLERYESGGITVAMEPVDLFSVVEEATSMVRGDAARSKIEIHLAGDSTMIMGDELRLVQVVTNLVSNAIKYSPAETAIDVRVHPPEDGTVRVSVADAGRGIPPEKIDTIFDRYQQVKRDDEKVGAGLGLAISKAIIEGHQGSIGVRNKDHGSEFWFTLPAGINEFEDDG